MVVREDKWFEEDLFCVISISVNPMMSNDINRFLFHKIKYQAPYYLSEFGQLKFNSRKYIQSCSNAIAFQNLASPKMSNPPHSNTNAQPRQDPLVPRSNNLPE